MKKIFVSLTMLLAVGITTVMATATPGTDPRVEKLFQKEFSGAEHVKWSEEQGFITATFVLGGQRTQAWFSKEGELLGSIRGISYNQLPLLVARAIYSRFSDAVFIELREVTNSEGTRYKIVLENNDRKYKVSIQPDGIIEEKERLKK